MKPKTLWSKDYICLLLAVVFASIPHQSITYLVPVYVLDIGGDNALSGLMVMGLTFSGIVTRLIFGPLIDKVGRKKILVLGSVTFAINNALYFFVDSLPGLFILRVFNGISQGIFFPVPPTLVADLAPEGKTVDAMGFFGVASSCGAAVAPAFGTFLYENYGPAGLFIVMTVLSVISAILTAVITEHYVPTAAVLKDSGKKPAFRLITVIEVSVLLPSVVYFVIGVGNSSVANFLAPFGLSRGIADISIFLLIANFAMILLRLLTARISKKFGMFTTTLAGLLMLIVSIGVLPLIGGMASISITAVVFGASIAITAQLLQVLILEMVPENRRGVANSTFMLASDIGVGVGASVWGGVSQYFGYSAMFLLSAAVMAAATFLHIKYLKPLMKNK